MLIVLPISKPNLFECYFTLTFGGACVLRSVEVLPDDALHRRLHAAAARFAVTWSAVPPGGVTGKVNRDGKGKKL